MLLPFFYLLYNTIHRAAAEQGLTDHEQQEEQHQILYKLSNQNISAMYRPELKRDSLGYDPEGLATRQLTRNVSALTQQPSALLSAKERALVPEAFFESSRNLVAEGNAEGLTGAINTCEIAYPAAVLQEIGNEDCGHIQFHHHVFCFHKGKKLHFWRYHDCTFNRLSKYLLQECADVITAICYQPVSFSDFGAASILLVAVAFGTSVKFYSLKNFEVEDQNGSPHLADLMITLESPDIVTQVTYLYREHDESSDKNTLSVLLGDSNGNLLLFDFVTKKKHIVDSMREKMKRQMKRQSYSQIRQILAYKQYVFCLVERYYEAGTLWKLIQKASGNSKSDVLVEQKVEIYRIDVSSHIYKRVVFREPNTEGRITGFSKYGDHPVENIVQKIKSSYNQYFESKHELNEKSLSAIGSLSVRNNFVELMFTSGESILVDQDLTFAEGPALSPRKPSTFNILSRNKADLEESLAQKVNLLKSWGSKLMVFEDFLICKQRDCTYFTPYIPKTGSFYIRSVREIVDEARSPSIREGSKFLILGHKSMTFVEPLTPCLVLFLYCAIMYEEYPNRRMIPQTRFFEDKVNKMAEYFGESQLLTMAIDLLMRASEGKLQINLRMDLFELVSKQVSSRYQTTFKQATRSYEQTEKSLMKNIGFTHSKNVEELIYKTIFLFEKVKVELCTGNTWQIAEIEAICVAFQTAISETFQKIKGWTARAFCTKRSEVYRILSRAKMLEDILQNYLQKDYDKSYGKKNSLFSDTSAKLGKQYASFLPQSQSFKTRFCQFSKLTMEKVILLLKVYDFVCEMDFHSASIPKFTDLLLNLDQSKRMLFAEAVIKTVGLNNDELIDCLARKIPQLRIDQIKKFNSWKALHLGKKSMAVDDQNMTQDTIGEQEVEELSDVINEFNFTEIRRYYLSPREEGRIGASESSAQFANGAAVLLRACLKKVLELRSQEIQKSNLVAAYKKSNQNYFGVLEIPSIEREISEVLKEIEFLTRYCHEILEQAFDRYAKNSLSKEQIRLVMESTRGLLTIEVRRSLQKILERLNLSDLVHVLSKRQLFSTYKDKQGTDPSNFMAQQLFDDVTRKYI